MVQPVFVVLFHGFVENSQDGHKHTRFSRGNEGQHGQQRVEEQPLVHDWQELAQAYKAIDAYCELKKDDKTAFSHLQQKARGWGDEQSTYTCCGSRL